jgi:hypothetical protein
MHNPFEDRTVEAARFKIGVCPILLLLGWAAVCFGASGPGIGFKVGVQTVEDPINLDSTTRARYELEIASPLLYDDHVDLAFAFGGSSIGTVSDQYAYVVDDVLIEESYTDHLVLFDIRLAARLYPLGDRSDIRPYVGAGIGYFWFLDYWEDEYSETFEDPLDPGTFYTYTEEYDGTETLAQGFFPFVTAGVTLPIGSNGELLFEFQYDFAKEDSGIDLGGPIYMIGARFRF